MWWQCRFSLCGARGRVIDGRREMTNSRRGNPRQKRSFRARSWHRPRSPFCCRACTQICSGIHAEGFAAPARGDTSLYLGERGWSPGSADPGFCGATRGACCGRRCVGRERIGRGVSQPHPPAPAPRGLKAAGYLRAGGWRAPSGEMTRDTTDFMLPVERRQHGRGRALLLLGSGLSRGAARRVCPAGPEVPCRRTRCSDSPRSEPPRVPLALGRGDSGREHAALGPPASSRRSTCLSRGPLLSIYLAFVNTRKGRAGDLALGVGAGGGGLERGAGAPPLPPGSPSPPP